MIRTAVPCAFLCKPGAPPEPRLSQAEREAVDEGRSGAVVVNMLWLMAMLRKTLGPPLAQRGEADSGRKQWLTDGVPANLMECQSVSPSWSPPCWCRVITCSEEQPRTPVTVQNYISISQRTRGGSQSPRSCLNVLLWDFFSISNSSQITHYEKIISEDIMLSIPVYLKRSWGKKKTCIRKVER